MGTRRPPPSCRYCGQRIAYARTAAGKMLPIDPEPNPRGNVACYTDASGTLVAHVVSHAEPALPFERIFMPHFASCPNLPRQRAGDNAVAAPVPAPEPEQTALLGAADVIDLDAARAERRAAP